MYSSSAVVVLALAAIGSAFNNSGANYPYTINAGSVSASESAQWCQAQQNSCLQICGNQANPNNCDGPSLTYNCVCTAFTTPNITLYQQTLPYFECLQYRTNCVAATDDAIAQRACINTPCGTLNPVQALANYSSSLAAGTLQTTSAGSSASSGAASVTSAASSGVSGAVSSATGGASSAISSAAGGASSAVASVTQGGGAAMATAGIGALGAAVMGFVAYMA